MTLQRKVILEELRSCRWHPTADEIYAKVRKRVPRISLGTVYRNLEMLVAQGAIKKVDLAGAQRRYDANLEDHHHIRCQRCGSLGDVFFKSSLPYHEMVSTCDDYEIYDVRLEFSGLCPECRNKRNSVC